MGCGSGSDSRVDCVGRVVVVDVVTVDNSRADAVMVGSATFRRGAVFPVDNTEESILGEERLADRTWLDRRILLATLLLIGPILVLVIVLPEPTTLVALLVVGGSFVVICRLV